jgi:hypothetical protein
MAIVFAARLNAQESAWLERARPQLEKVLGYSLPEAPVFQWAAPGELADPGVLAHLRWRFPHLRGELFARAAKDAQTVSDSATLARLIEGKSVILIRPEIRSCLSGADGRGKSSAGADLCTLALTHELVRHALDVRYGLARRRQACRDAEEWFALQAVVEGRAQEVTGKLARNAGMEKTFPRLAERFLNVPDSSPDPGLRTTSQSAMRQLHWAYTSGRQFWVYLEEQGMKDIEKEVFAHPPRLTQWIDRPELYLHSRQSGQADLAETMTRLELALPEAEWRAAQQAWTPVMVLQTAQALGVDRLAEKRVEAWQEGRSLLWTNRNAPQRMVGLSVARFQSASAARGFFHLTLDLARQSAEKLAVTVSRSRAVTVANAEDAVMCECTGAGLAISTLRAHAGPLFIELSWYGTAADLGLAQVLVGGLQ